MSKFNFFDGPRLARFVVFFGVFAVGVHFVYALYDLGTWKLGSMIIDLVLAAAILFGVSQMLRYKKAGWVLNCCLGVLMLLRGFSGSISVSTDLTFFQAVQPYISFLVGLVFVVALIPLRKTYFQK